MLNLANHDFEPDVMIQHNHFSTIIIGAGPAGLTAGIYLSRARARTLILNEGAVGGQMVLTHEIANYPGVESISGYQLSNIMKKQALSFDNFQAYEHAIGFFEKNRIPFFKIVNFVSWRK